MNDKAVVPGDNSDKSLVPAANDDEDLAPNAEHETGVIPDDVLNCRYCGNEMLPGAKVCCSCFHYKHRILNWIKHIASATALIMVLVAVAQLIIAAGEKIDTNKMLDEVKDAKRKADVIFDDVQKQEKLLSDRLITVGNNIDALDKKFSTSQKQLSEKHDELSGRVEKTRKTAEYEIKKVIESVNKQAVASKQRLKSTEAVFDERQRLLSSQLGKLNEEFTAQLAELKWRNYIAGLTDKAIAKGSRTAYDELIRTGKDYANKNNDKFEVVSSYILQVKRFYIGINRYKSAEITTSKGEPVDFDKEATDKIIKEMTSNQKPSVRHAVAEYIKDRKERGVPEALIRCIESDKSLDVVARCVQSFQTFTGYRSIDVFGGEHLIQYWNENKNDIDGKLKEPQSDQKN